MELGNFSVSLSVKDLATSRAFYEKLGFRVFGGDQAQNWLIMKNGGTNIGLFQGMFDKNILTFNPGWDSDAKPLPTFTDVREIEGRLKAKGITVTTPVATAEGPGHLLLIDPDGNQILIDQHR